MTNIENFKRFKLTEGTYYYDISTENSSLLIECLNKSNEDVGVSINFNYSNFDSLNFLLRIRKLIGIRIIGNGCSLQPIESLKSLRSIILEDVKKPKLNYSNITFLREIRADWVASMQSLFDASQLCHIALWGYKSKFKDLTDFVKLKKLQSLNLTKGNVESLVGVEQLASLASIELNYLRNLTDVSLLSKSKSLREIEIESSPKIRNSETIFSNTELTVLKLINTGALKSLKGIEKCRALYFLNLHKTIIDDRNLLPLTKLNCLKDLKLDNKKGYSHKLSELEEILFK